MECIFCKIVRGEIPTDLVFENDNLVAFKDINPVAPVHILVAPRKHIISTNEMGTYDQSLVGEIFQVMQKLARQFGISESGYRIFINTGADGGQEVPHLHFHLIGGKKLGKCW